MYTQDNHKIHLGYIHKHIQSDLHLLPKPAPDRSPTLWCTALVSLAIEYIHTEGYLSKK